MRVLLLISAPSAGVGHIPFVRALAARGHSVLVAYDAGGQGLSVLEALAKECPTVQLRRSPARERRDKWQPFVTWLRTFQDFLLYFEDRNDGKHRNRLLSQAERRLSARAAAVARHVYFFTRRPGVRILRAMIRGLDLAIAPPPEYAAFIKKVQPDVVLLASLTDFATPHADFVKAVSALGTPAAMLVRDGYALRNQGAVQQPPRRVIVATEEQKSDLGAFHRVAASKVDVIGGVVIDGQTVPDPHGVTTMAERLAAERRTSASRLWRAPLRPVLWLPALWTHSLALPEPATASSKPARNHPDPQVPRLPPSATVPGTVAKAPAVEKSKREAVGGKVKAVKAPKSKAPKQRPTKNLERLQAKAAASAAKAAARAERADMILAKRRRARLRAAVHELDVRNEWLRKRIRRVSGSIARGREVLRRDLRLTQDRTHKRLKRARRATLQLRDRVRHSMRVVWRRLRGERARLAAGAQDAPARARAAAQDQTASSAAPGLARDQGDDRAARRPHAPDASDPHRAAGSAAGD